MIAIIAFIIYYFNQDRTKVYIQINKSDTLKTQYFYSDNNKLLKIITPNLTIEYDFDELHRRIAKKINSKTVEKYLWLEDNKLLATLDINNNIKQLYNYKSKNASLPYSMTQKGKTYYFIYNKMKSLKLVVDKNQNILKVLKYNTNGEMISDSNPSLTIAIGYAGGLYDEHSLLLHFKEGIYNPKISKWITKIADQDIIQNLKDLNLTKEEDVYQCSATLDVYYHSYLCAGKQCGGLYANDYLNYFNGTGEIIDNSNYFNKKICKKVKPNNTKSNQTIFAKCVNEQIQPRVAKLFDALRYNCHDEVKNIIETCSQKALPKGL